jgi:hypothetical protein
MDLQTSVLLRDPKNIFHQWFIIIIRRYNPQNGEKILFTHRFIFAA